MTCAADTLPLSRLGRGDDATVVNIDHVPPALLARLAARGLVPGATLHVLRAGDPLLILCDDSRWALTRDDAATIEVVRTRTSVAGKLRALLRR